MGIPSLIGPAAERLGVAIDQVVVDRDERAVFRTADAYVKVERGGSRARREVTGIYHGAAAGLPIPAIRHADLGDPSILVLAAVAGAPLTEASPPAAWRAAGEAVALLHRAPVPRCATPFDRRGDSWQSFMRWWRAKELRDAAAAGWITAGVAASLTRLTDRAFGSLSPPPVLLHGDLQPAHVFVDRDRLTGLIDWGDAGTGDPLWDVAVLTARHPERLDAVAGGYGPVDRDVIRAYWVVRLVGSASWMAERGFDPGPDMEAALALLAGA